MNPNWIRTVIASILLAWLLKEGFEIPFFNTFVAIATIYVMNVVMTEMKTGVQTSWAWIKNAGKVAMGIIIFLALRFIIGWVIDLHPPETYRTVMDSPGRLKGILFGQNTPQATMRVVMFEILFAFVAGGLTVAWAQGKKRGLVGGIFAVSLLIVSMQIALPTYAKTWPSREMVSTNLVEHGVWGVTKGGIGGLLFGRDTKSSPLPSTATSTTLLVLRYEGVTPCSTRIDYRAQIWGDGPDFLVQFPGIENPILFGRGKFTAPDGVKVGETFFKAADPTQPVTIRVYERKRP